MKLKNFSKKSILTLVAVTVAAVAQQDSLYAGSDKEQVVVEGLAEGEPVDLTVFLPEGAPSGSYVLDGAVVRIPAGQSVVIPAGATQITLPPRTIVTIVSTSTIKKPVTQTYVTTEPVVIGTQTVESVQTTGGAIVLIGVNSELPPERRTSSFIGDEASDSND